MDGGPFPSTSCAGVEGTELGSGYFTLADLKTDTGGWGCRGGGKNRELETGFGRKNLSSNPISYHLQAAVLSKLPRLPETQFPPL